VEDVTGVLWIRARGQSGESDEMNADVLCQNYAGRVYKFAQMVSADSTSAEDLAQDALERAIRGLATFDPTKGEIEGWLWRIVVNAGRDAGKVARRRRMVFESLVDRWSGEAQAGDLDGRVTSADVLAEVRALSQRHRAVVALRFGADLSYGQVGRALGISEAAALMATRRALAILRTRLAEGVQQR
jgi:RNA polymerase sigma-70 factor (ECF subfamily)